MAQKHEEREDEGSCWSRALDDERLFVLLGRDAAAPATIRFWAMARLSLGLSAADDPEILEAFSCADRMEAERAALRQKLGKG